MGVKSIIGVAVVFLLLLFRAKTVRGSRWVRTQITDWVGKKRERWGNAFVFLAVGGLALRGLDAWQGLEFLAGKRQGIETVIGSVADFVISPGFGWGLVILGVAGVVALHFYDQRQRKQVLPLGGGPGLKGDLAPLHIPRKTPPRSADADLRYWDTIWREIPDAKEAEFIAEHRLGALGDTEELTLRRADGGPLPAVRCEVTHHELGDWTPSPVQSDTTKQRFIYPRDFEGALDPMADGAYTVVWYLMPWDPRIQKWHRDEGSAATDEFTFQSSTDPLITDRAKGLLRHEDGCAAERFEAFFADAGPGKQPGLVTRCIDCGAQVVDFPEEADVGPAPARFVHKDHGDKPLYLLLDREDLADGTWNRLTKCIACDMALIDEPERRDKEGGPPSWGVWHGVNELMTNEITLGTKSLDGDARAIHLCKVTGPDGVTHEVALPEQQGFNDPKGADEPHQRITETVVFFPRQFQTITKNYVANGTYQVEWRAFGERGPADYALKTDEFELKEGDLVR